MCKSISWMGRACMEEVYKIFVEPKKVKAILIIRRLKGKGSDLSGTLNGKRYRGRKRMRMLDDPNYGRIYRALNNIAYTGRHSFFF